MNDILPLLINKIQQEKETAIANVLSALVVLLDLHNNELSVDLLHKKWDYLKNIIATKLPTCKKEIRIDLGDARHLNLAANTASLLITSPPYINVFNYH